MMAEPKPKKLSVKEITFIKGLVAGKSQREAGMIATGGTSLGNGAVAANRMLKKGNVQEELAKAFEKHGITMDAAIAPIGKALNAKKLRITGEGDQAMAEVVEDVELQLKGSDRALKLMGVGKDQDGGNTYNFFQVTQQMGDKYAD
jgi:hypothetical protein